MLKIVPLVLLLCCAAAEPQGTQPVLVELFTSQGCSSCPPADELLSRIARDPALRGRVIPLAYHVDYWDHLGWRDPFSSREWSLRQGEYVRAMRLASSYTPQVVVNGARQMVGSSSSQVYRAIDDESRRAPEGSVSVRVDGGDVVVRASAPRAGAELMVVTFEDGATTNVLRGENSGRTIANDAIVRSLQRVATLDGKHDVEQRVKLPPGPRIGVAAFLQDTKTKRIWTAATTVAAFP